MAKSRRTTAHGLSMRSAILFLVLTDVLLSCCATAAASTVTKAGCTDTERDALLAFKAGIVSDPFRNLSSWGNHGGDCCSWSGVVCSNRTGITSAHVHVVRLGLYGAGFFAEKLSPALLSLTRLKVLNIGYNDFGGIRIPEFLGSFKRLRYLDLSSANFQGAIPPQFGNLSTLTFLNLTTWPQGQMRADNLGWLLGLPTLTYLDMDGVDLSKASHNWLPIISTLHSLTRLSLYGCDLVSLPSSFSHPNLTALTYLDLRYNGFNSTLPSWLWRLTSLSTLDLRYNHFYGTLPSAIGNLTRLEFLDLSDNLLSGSIPADIGNLSTLTILNLATWTQGQMRADNLGWLLGLPSLTFLAMDGVDLSKASHNWLPIISTLHSLTVLSLYGCDIASLPSSFSHPNLTALTYLRLSYNGFNSTLPSWLWQLTSLSTLYLSNNHFYGTLPSAIGNLTRLEFLDLSDNLLSGSIPADIGNLSTLTILNLATWPQGQMRADNLGWLLGLPSLTFLDMDGVDLSKASHNWLPIISTLHSLTRLSLYGCDLVSLPSSFSHPNLTALTYLSLSYNGFNSTLPSWLWQLTSLSTLDLSYNHFYGTLPSAIGNLTRLGFLDLFDSLLSGPIPEEIGKLFNLEYLDLSFNFFDGNISQAHFANLKKLDTLHLSKNFFLSITVDHNWLPPFHLQTIDLDSCKLSTSPKFPRWLRSQKSIILLNLSNASIEDSLMPDHWFWISYSSTIQSIDLSYNKISGTLPRFMVNMTNLAFLNLCSNLFEGLVPPWPPQLHVLDLSNNFFSGQLPSTLESSQISCLILSNNHIEGSIPSSICSLNDIELVDLSNNNMTGKIPTQCWHVATLLKYIVLGNNKLSGRIPTSIGSLLNLRSLHLNNNSLYGHLPSQLQNCSFLSFIDFGENNLSGNIPAWMGTSFQNLTILRLCSNFFSGSIPLELGQLSTLQIIDLANNRLSGLLPYSFGSLSAVISVSKTSMEDAEYYHYSRMIHKINNYISLVTKGHQYNFSTLVLSLTKIIDLSDNSLTGTIPIEWGYLAGLQTLNLSRNNLMGKIPESIGEMRSLETLDLSFNKLEGVIPQGLAALNLLHHLNLSYNNFSGNIPTGNQLQTLYDASIYIGNTYLCGALLNKSCSNDTSIIVPVDTSLWLSIDLSALIGFLVGLWSVFIILLFKKAWRYLYFGMIDKLYEKFYVALKKCMKAPNFR